MAPDGEVAKALAAAGYQLAEMPKWFGVHGEDGAPHGEGGGVGDGEVAEEVVYTPRTPVPIAQVQPGIYQFLFRVYNAVPEPYIE